MDTKSNDSDGVDEMFENGTQYKLEKYQELCCEVEADQKVKVKLISGLAEMFGTELTKGRIYTFSGRTSIGIYTYHGCTITLLGNCDDIDVSKETPMIFYINVHGGLEKMRSEAEANNTRGPVTMICGPKDTGKTTLSRILLNYAVRKQRSPVFVDLDVWQQSIAIPGTIGAQVMERPAGIEEGFAITAPIALHYGLLSPEFNTNLYNNLVTRMAEIVNSKMEADPKVKQAGVIVNTCGWVTGAGFKTLVHIATAFEVDLILVIEKTKLHNKLVREVPSSVKLLLTPKSGGVVEKSKETRAESRESQIRKYFYGVGSGKSHYPHSFEVPFSHLKIYKIGAPSVPGSCLPIGMKADDIQNKLVPVSIDSGLCNRVLSLSFATTTKDAVESNVQGFIWINRVDMERQTITVLSPQPGPLPACILLLSDTYFMDSH